MTRKNFKITTIFLNGVRVRARATAPPGKRFTERGIDEMLSHRVDETEKAFPDRDFRLVALTNGDFNIVETKLEMNARTTWNVATRGRGVVSRNSSRQRPFAGFPEMKRNR
jgi:hypothetical protein